MSGSTAPPELLNMLANPKGIDVAGAYNNANLLARGIWANREMQARQAAGEAYQQATDASGRVDPARAQALIAANPQAALAAQPSATSGQALSGAQQQQSLQQNAALGQAVTSVLALPDDRLKAGVVDQVGRLVDAGVVPRDRAMLSLMHLSPDPGQLRTQLETFRKSLLSPAEQQQSIYGVPGTQTGPDGSTIGFTQSPQGGAVSVPAQPGAPLGLSPAQLAQQVEVVDSRRTLPDGSPNPTYGQRITRNLGDVLQEQGYRPGAAAPTGAAGPPPSPANPPRLPGRGAPPAPASPGVATSLPPGEDKRIGASVDAYNADVASAGTFQSRIFPLAQANALLASGTSTGPGTEGVNRLRSWLVTQGPAFGINPDAISTAKYDELGKYLQQIVNANPFAAASDARLASALAGSPNAHLSTLANQDVVKSMIGLERMKQAAFQEFQRSGQPPSAYASFQAKWATEHDPRAFIADQLSPEQQRKMVESFTPEQRRAFARSLDVIANTPGLMTLPAMPH